MILHSDLAFLLRDSCVFIRFRTTGKIFNLACLNAQSRTFLTLVGELLYADDADFVAHTEEYIQETMDLFSGSCTAFGLPINLEKTRWCSLYHPVISMWKPTSGGPEWGWLSRSFILAALSTKMEPLIQNYPWFRIIERTSRAFGGLERRVWSDWANTVRTKISVLESCVSSILLYSSETWTTYRRHIKTLERFHQTCLRRILNIGWQSFTPDITVLQPANVTSIEMYIKQSQTRWAGHLVRMEDSRPRSICFTGNDRGTHPRNISRTS